MKAKLCTLWLSLLLVALPVAAQEGGDCVGGRPDAPIKIEVFSDFQCPACRTFYLETVRQVLADYARVNKVCVVYHEFPLGQHQYALPAARYAEAARRVGRIQWIRVADALFTFQASWAASGNVEAVVQKALSKEDFARVKELLSNSSIKAAIDNDLALARRKDVRQTPTFFITANGQEQKNAGAVQFEILKRYLDNVLPR